MARRTYFAFHYQNDIWRVNQIRKSWITKEDIQDAGFYDASLWEEAKKTSDVGIKRMINSGLGNTSVTAILIGTETSNRRWVRYEIIKSFEKSNGLLGIYIHNQENQEKKKATKGSNPFECLGVKITDKGKKVLFYELKNSKWIEFADLPSKASNYDEKYDGKFYRLSEFGYKLYDWIDNDGYNNLSSWVEEAASKK
ncbi:TIR domain-containing protein [Leptospira dzoumogneensis]|uniref:Thoeris protein ThsB TIR-like domain-containing protein n=1 Tax=Leptospira dzoumogneensis TaxID=2484904 RepID=A0A4Z1AL75_9LEPT|nr:TIR domain-containing protein [Leptospira dzoumogneensis]TGN00308.1 hypothetical protein EHR06_09330 [Leptospira dzoumogneensis]